MANITVILVILAVIDFILSTRKSEAIHCLYFIALNVFRLVPKAFTQLQSDINQVSKS